MTAQISFDGVFKMGGVCATAASTLANCGWIPVKETEDGISIASDLGLTPKIMTIAEARSLAAQIMELARRHEVRKTQR